MKLKAVCKVSKLGAAMILCSCNVVSDRDLGAAVGDCAARPSVGAVFRKMGCEAKCGRCARSMAAAVDRLCDRPAGAYSGAEGGGGCRIDELAA
jgi:bacterioferritin-associated ferredoxin